jgi:hypothetical protein
MTALLFATVVSAAVLPGTVIPSHTGYLHAGGVEPDTVPARGRIPLGDPRRSNRMHHSTDLWGWILFLLCALTFVVVGFRDRDVLMTLGSVLFLAACVLFLVPYLRQR